MRISDGSSDVCSSDLAALALALAGCAGSDRPQLPPATFVAQQQVPGEQYIIGPLDKLNIFVWRNPELSSQVQVRPDGRITTPSSEERRSGNNGDRSCRHRRDAWRLKKKISKNP